MGKVPNTPENKARCLCGGCPSYPAEGGFFCARAYREDITKRGCLCSDCANFKDFGLVDGYYCAAGIAEEGPH
jgi:methylamine---glutamate N-methyltransferase subunit C